jgi:hypothetical protein
VIGRSGYLVREHLPTTRLEKWWRKPSQRLVEVGPFGGVRPISGDASELCKPSIQIDIFLLTCPLKFD